MKYTIPGEREESVVCMCDEITYGFKQEWCDVTWKPLKMSLLRERHYFEHDPKGKTPVIVWICGGAFTHMDRNVWMPELVYFVKKGYAIASIGYDADARMHFPEPVLNIKAGIRYLRAHAEEFQLDAEKMFIMGESAGAYLADFVALTNGRPEYEKGDYLDFSSEVKGAVSLYGCAKEVHMEGERIVMPDLGGYVTEDAPPVLLFHGTEDDVVSCKESEYLYELLENSGIRTDLYLVEGAYHADVPMYQKAVKDIIIQFLSDIA